MKDIFLGLLLIPIMAIVIPLMILIGVFLCLKHLSIFFILILVWCIRYLMAFTILDIEI